jgi:hypothetical protein
MSRMTGPQKGLVNLPRTPSTALFTGVLAFHFDKVIEVFATSRAVVITVLPIVGLPSVQDIGIGLAGMGLTGSQTVSRQPCSIPSVCPLGHPYRICRLHRVSPCESDQLSADIHRRAPIAAIAWHGRPVIYGRPVHIRSIRFWFRSAGSRMRAAPERRRG